MLDHPGNSSVQWEFLERHTQFDPSAAALTRPFVSLGPSASTSGASPRSVTAKAVDGALKPRLHLASFVFLVAPSPLLEKLLRRLPRR